MDGMVEIKYLKIYNTLTVKQISRMNVHVNKNNV